MKRAFLPLLPAVLLVFLFIAGCNDETEPKFSRIKVYPECGVAPLQVECLAMATGGNESGDPTGGNNNLSIKWDFGDNSSSSNTSVAYHSFVDPGHYTVIATAEDPDGKTTTISQMVRVMADTLAIEASHNFANFVVTTNDTLQFDVHALACDIDPEIDDDYRNLVFHWGMDEFYTIIVDDDPVDVEYQYSSRNPSFQYTVPGNYNVIVSVSFPGLATTRHDTLNIEVVDP